jgi:aminoglycoside phosphotransferase (APT) family kinase protein
MPDAETTRVRLAKWLEDNIAGWRDVALAPVELQHGSGWSADIFFIDVSYRDDRGPQERGLVVRRQGDSFDLVLGGDLEFQSKMLAALTRVGHLPVPEYIGMEPSSELLGAPFLIMERVPGRAATQKPNYNLEGWLTELNPGQRFDVWRNGIRAFAELHKLDWRDGFGFLDRPERGEPGLEQYVNYLREWYQWAARGRDIPIVQAALDHVIENRPSSAATSVLWGDPTPFNTMYNPDGTVASLIDWELAALGPGEIDLAWWLYFDELFSEGFGIERLAGLPDRDQTIRLYEEAVGRQVEHMDYYDILTGLRMGIVAIRQFDRQVDLGNIPADNKSLTDNQMTVYLAKKLGMAVPELGPDFAAFVANLTPVEEE